MRNFLKMIWKNEWSPFYLLNGEDKGHFVEYTTPPRFSFFEPAAGFWYSHYDKTRLGKWVDNLPGILALIFLFFHYVIFGTIWVICFFIILNIIKGIVALFTKRWTEVW